MRKITITITVCATIIALALIGCTQTDRAEHALRVQGFTDIKMTGYAMFGCGNDDRTCDGFKAKAPNGERVEGVVGCGYLGKNCTVRLE